MFLAAGLGRVRGEPMLTTRARAVRLAVLFICFSLVALAQSTYGTILGTVSDPTGARVSGVTVTITNQGEDISRTVTTDESGNYEALNMKAGAYSIKCEAGGFKGFQVRDLQLVARQTLRVNISLEVGSITDSVDVNAAPPVVTTDTGTIATSFESKQVLGLPANFRGAGSTSPLRVLALQAGVTSDNSFGFAVQGATPTQTEISLDGISTVGVSNNKPLAEVFPSAEGISEMKVQAVGNNAEYGQVGDITTTSKGGTNNFHGSAFEYLQNRAFDATALGATTKPQKSANTFGGSFGGPILHNKTFFFGTYEQMEYHTGSTLQGTVPHIFPARRRLQQRKLHGEGSAQCQRSFCWQRGSHFAPVRGGFECPEVLSAAEFRQHERPEVRPTTA